MTLWLSPPIHMFNYIEERGYSLFWSCGIQWQIKLTFHLCLEYSALGYLVLCLEGNHGNILLAIPSDGLITKKMKKFADDFC